MPPLLQEFTAKNPNAVGQITEEPTQRLLELLANCEIDIALVSGAIDNRQWRTSTLCDEELVLGVPERHPLAGRDIIHLGDVAREPFVLMKSSHSLTRQVVDACRGAGFTPRVAFRTSQLLTLQRLVGIGLGVSLFPVLATSAQAGAGVVFRRLQPPAPFRPLQTAWHPSTELSPIAKRFVAHLHDVARSPQV